MRHVRKPLTLAMLGGIAACTDGPIAPAGPTEDQAFVLTSSCPLADVPAGASVLLCFETTLQPGVWHGWILELSAAQPPGTGNGLDFFDRNRLNHAYVLASPEGFTRLTDPEPLAPLPSDENIYAFQPEWNGAVWFDVLRLWARPDGPPQDVSVVVYWADAPTVAADIRRVIDALLSAGSVNGGQANALSVKIEQAIRLLDKGKVDETIQVLEGFVQQVHDLAADGVLTSEEASQLVERAEYFLEVI